MNPSGQTPGGQESIADLLTRFGYTDVFNVCLAGGSRDTAILLPPACGVSDAKAQRIVNLAIQAAKSCAN